MRLGQLSRQVNVSQKEIVSFLKKERGIELKVHPNVKVEDEFVELIANQFEVKPSAEATTEEPEAAETKSETKEEVLTEVIDADEQEESTEEKVVEIKEYLPGEEFIRPSGPIEKIETEIPQLDGIKVVGKIDLPEFHKQEPAPDKAPEDENGESTVSETGENEAATAELPNATPLFKRPNRRKKKETEKPKRTKKVVSEDEKKKKELAKEEAKRKAIKKAKKEEARKKHLELVKSYQKPQNPKAKSAKTKSKSVQHATPKPTPPKKQPKTIFGKIWRWMNTE